jgi:hypothetical protein
VADLLDACLGSDEIWCEILKVGGLEILKRMMKAFIGNFDEVKRVKSLIFGSKGCNGYLKESMVIVADVSYSRLGRNNINGDRIN